MPLTTEADVIKNTLYDLVEEMYMYRDNEDLFCSYAGLVIIPHKGSTMFAKYKFKNEIDRTLFLLKYPHLAKAVAE